MCCAQLVVVVIPLPFTCDKFMAMHMWSWRTVHFSVKRQFWMLLFRLHYFFLVANLDLAMFTGVCWASTQFWVFGCGTMFCQVLCSDTNGWKINRFNQSITPGVQKKCQSPRLHAKDFYSFQKNVSCSVWNGSSCYLSVLQRQLEIELPVGENLTLREWFSFSHREPQSWCLLCI